MSQIPQRPKWNDPAVKSSAVTNILPGIADWCLGNGVLDADYDPKHLTALLTVALIESADAYSAARYLDDFLDWPVDGEMIAILDSAYRQMPYLVAPVVTAWVMAHAIRFTPKKGDVVRFRVGDAELTGTIIDVLGREARGWAKIARSGDIVPPVMQVLSEDLIKNLGPRPKRKPPTGGMLA